MLKNKFCDNNFISIIKEENIKEQNKNTIGVVLNLQWVNCRGYHTE